ncbi:MAG TPA: universal stress protein [Candidatus Acidoferrales bacterium]|nr:universal stress protein [Candidatus Acidoferrales bacterium]
MVKLSRILVPVEFSPRCAGAVQYAEALAGHFHSEIVLLHVVIPPMASFSSLEAMAYSSASDLARELFTVRTNDLAAVPCAVPNGSAVRRVVLEGDPARVIAEYAKSEHCDLIVMPTHGYGPFRRFLLGSVTAKVLHDSVCPVCTGPHMEHAPDYSDIRFRHVACAIDLGLHSREVLCWAARFAHDFRARITVLHAIPSSATRMGGFYFDPDWAIQLTKAARERIQYLMQELGIAGEVRIQSGETPVAVRSEAEEVKADLLVIGRGSSPRAHGHLPTNSYAIVRESPCPVVSI